MGFKNLCAPFFAFKGKNSMKNKLFKELSLEERQKTLTFVLREKTKSRLTAEEEARLIWELILKNQFLIRVFISADSYRKAISFAKIVKGRVVFGTNELWRLKALDEDPMNAIAIVTEASEDPEHHNQVYIFIPPCRKCKSAGGAG